MGLRGSQEYRWVTIGPGAQQEMEEWLQYLDANTRTLRVSPFQLQWNQHQLVLSHSGLRWKAEVSEKGVHEGEKEEEIASTQPKVWRGGVKCARKDQRGKPRTDENGTVHGGHKRTKRRQTCENRHADNTITAPGRCPLDGKSKMGLSNPP
jgi:hypothetical protein